MGAFRAETGFPCPLCGSQYAQLFDQRVWRSFPLSNLLCRVCGMVYQGGDSPARQPDFYEHTYRQVYQGSETPTAKDLRLQQQRGAHLAQFLKEAGAQDIQRHLDIGASAGLVLREIQREFGSQPAGVEPGQAYRQAAQESGLRMFPSIEALPEDEKPFDLISLSHVLEHLPDPVGTLANLRANHLSPSGWLLVEVPNLYAHDSFELAHLLSFSPHTLAETVRQAGFTVQTIRAHGAPRSDLLRLYITLTARPLPGDAVIPARPRPERGVRAKRRLGMLYRRLVERLLPGQAWRPLPVPEP